ncbi:glycine--tRNA ligase subunit beta [Hwanghaeella sp. LZ110]|uniref:glycine--tRNA ligase subunit beta n=1 Tax=Hwanghaeella sp. LZ110 TaxID=3402810 RepID=UPI003B670BFC
MAELLIELFSEEIPARMQRQAAGDLQRLVTDGLTKANLTFDETRIYWTPRRLTLVVEGLPTRQPDLREEKKGPKVGAPDQAVQGFLRSAGLDSLDQCEQQDTPKGPVWIAVVEKKGGASADVLPSLIEAAIRALPWPKSMRFAAQSFRWVRPLHRILAVFDGAALAGDFDLGGATVAFSNTSSGHRFLSPEPFTVLNFSDYIAKLREAHVVLDPEERKQAILDGLRSAADREGLTVKDDPALLEEVTNLVEYPDVLIGKIDDEFMDVPAEALSTSMRAHQKYFSLIRPDGSLAPRFAVVANMKAADGGAKIIAGNERVLRARLADAKFFWDQDRATKLEDRVEDLKKVVFHAKLGTVAERVERIAALAAELSKYIPDCDPVDACRAAKLAKADLTTEMVGEFPELQGIMGRYYALAQNEKPAVADAIAHHYSPAGPNDACPTAPLSVAVALAEKLDTLVGFWLIDEKPTGSKDPFALRRAALGVIRLILENGIKVNLNRVFLDQFIILSKESDARSDRISLEAQLEAGVAKPRLPIHMADEVAFHSDESATHVYTRFNDKISDLLSFFADRLRVHLKDEGVSHSLIQALFALGDEDDLVRLVARVHALKAFLESEDGANLLTAYRRAANILRAEEKKDGTTYFGKPDSALFATPEETALAAALDAAEGKVKACIKTEDFAGAMAALAGLRQPVDAFFEAVIVNAEEADLRQNRLLLLARIRSVMGTLADFGQIEG